MANKSLFTYKQYVTLMERPFKKNADGSYITKTTGGSSLANRDEKARREKAALGNFTGVPGGHGVYVKGEYDPNNPDVQKYQWDSNRKEFVPLPQKYDPTQPDADYNNGGGTDPVTGMPEPEAASVERNENATPRNFVRVLFRTMMEYKNGDIEEAQDSLTDLIDTFKLAVTKKGFLVSNQAVSGMDRKAFGGKTTPIKDAIRMLDQDAARELQRLLPNFTQADFLELSKELDVRIPVEGVDVTASGTGNRTLFSPSRIQFPNNMMDLTGKSTTSTDGTVHIEITPPHGEPHKLKTVSGVFEDYQQNYKLSSFYKTIKYKLQQSLKDNPDLDVEEQADLLYQSAFIYNQNIRHLSQLFSHGKADSAVIFNGGQDSAIRAAGNIKSGLSKLPPQIFEPAYREEIFRIIDDLTAVANDETHFNQKSQELIEKLNSLQHVKMHIPAIVENLSIIEAAAKGYIVIIPKSTEFPLADFIALDKNKISSFDSIDQVRVLYDEGNPFVTASVKKGLGAASASKDKINLTVYKSFYDSNRNITRTSDEIRNTLVTLAGDGRFKNQIFGDKDDYHFAKTQVDRMMDNYGELIYNHYTADNTLLPAWDSMNAVEQKTALANLRQCFSLGKTIEKGKCDTTLPAYLKSKGGCGYYNRDRWELYNTTGRIIEALYNMTAQKQAYSTHSYWPNKKGRIVMDGKKKLSGMRFQPNGYKTKKEPCTPQQNFPTHTVPISVK